jgi:hypothetical protein
MRNADLLADDAGLYSARAAARRKNLHFLGRCHAATHLIDGCAGNNVPSLIQISTA